MADPLDAYVEVLTSGRLVTRVTADLWWDAERGPEQIHDLLARRARLEAAAGPDRLLADTVKLMIDGMGQTFLDDEAFRTAILTAQRAGFSAHIHACIDQAVHRTLDGIEAARAENPDARRFRHQIAHLMVVQRADRPRFARLDAIANVQALWASGQVICPEN